MKYSEIASLFQSQGLPAVATLVDHLVRPSVRLIPNRSPNTVPPPQASKLGGVPDVPPDFVWPVSDGVPMSFVAQINLQDIAAFDSAVALPKQGMLALFYDASGETYGDQLSDRDGWQVAFFTDPTYLVSASPPTASQFRVASFTCNEELTIVLDPSLDLPAPLTPEQQQQYDTVVQSVSATFYQEPQRHRMLGYPDAIQDDMRLQCALLTHGQRENPTPAIVRDAQTWRLLLQIDTDEELGMRWGSSGMLYYWIPEQDMAAAVFNRGWLVLQSE